MLFRTAVSTLLLSAACAAAQADVKVGVITSSAQQNIKVVANGRFQHHRPKDGRDSETLGEIYVLPPARAIGGDAVRR